MSTSRPSKRKVPTETFDIPVWEEIIKQKELEGLDEEEINSYMEAYAAKLIASVPPNALKKVEKPPSFSKYTWKKAMSDYTLPLVAAYYPMKAFEEAPLPFLRLPKGLQLQLYQRGWETIDVYGELIDQGNEATVVRTLEPVRTHCHLIVT